MSRPAAWLAWGLAAAAVALNLLSHLFVLLGIGIATPGDEDVGAGGIGFVVAFYAFPLVGLVIATRRPGHTIGWLFLALGVVLGVTNAAASYADYALFANPGRLPAGAWVGWTVEWLDPLFFFFIVLLVLFFPDGRLASPRWRAVLAVLVVSGVATVVTAAVKPGLIFETSLPVENPAGVHELAALRNDVSTAASLAFLAAAVVTGVGAVLRFRRTRGVERQQFKWFAFAVCILLAAFLATALTAVGMPDRLAEVMMGAGFAAIPLGVGIAILRYRLYEIDRVVSKTLVYGGLTVILGAAYAGLVLAGQELFSSVAGGSNLAIAVSTLVVAALFLPVRSRVQRLVDRRFYRRRYDAQRTLESFGARLREQVDLDSLQADLREVVADTMQPAHLSLWLRRGARG